MIEATWKDRDARRDTITGVGTILQYGTNGDRCSTLELRRLRVYGLQTSHVVYLYSVIFIDEGNLCRPSSVRLHKTQHAHFSSTPVTSRVQNTFACFRGGLRETSDAADWECCICSGRGLGAGRGTR